MNGPDQFEPVDEGGDPACHMDEWAELFGLDDREAEIAADVDYDAG